MHKYRRIKGRCIKGRRIKWIKQQGTAIIAALFVTSLVAIMAIAMLDRFRSNLRSTELIIQSTQGNLLAQGAIAWAMDTLSNNWRQQKPNQLIDPIPIRSHLQKVENSLISSVIWDAQARFNINNLSQPSYEADFIRLIRVVSPQTSEEAAKAITSAIIYWITSNGRNNALDDYYLKLNPPYSVPHRLMANASELRLIKGVDSALFSNLAPYITALPEVTPININQAKLAVLMSLSPTLTIDAAKSLIAIRRATPFVDRDVFLQNPIVKNNAIQANKVTCSSHYFLVNTEVKSGDQTTNIHTLIQRVVNNDNRIETSPAES